MSEEVEYSKDNLNCGRAVSKGVEQLLLGCAVRGVGLKQVRCLLSQQLRRCLVVSRTRKPSLQSVRLVKSGRIRANRFKTF